LDRLPLNLNGKVDRSALPAPDRLAQSEAAADSSATELENKLRTLWGRVLHCCVGLDENFFDLGGTSLRMIELHQELVKLLGRELPITNLFEHATVRSLAGWLSGSLELDGAFRQVQDRAKRQREVLARQRRSKGIGA